MMNRLQAEEALATISQVAAGNGLMDKKDQKQYLDQLRRAANGGRLPRPEAVTAASLQAMGVKFETVDEQQQVARLKANGGVLLDK
jgi:hypothetical protein